MKIELKNVTYSKALSQETSAYTADIWVDGVKRGSVRNYGCGGADFVQPHALERELDAYAKTQPLVDGFPQSTELVLGALLDRHLAAKDLKRLFKKKCLFFAADGKLYNVCGLTPPKDAQKVLNTLPFDEALDLYLAGATPR